jgi:hypothetical protein
MTPKLNSALVKFAPSAALAVTLALGASAALAQSNPFSASPFRLPIRTARRLSQRLRRLHMRMAAARPAPGPIRRLSATPTRGGRLSGSSRRQRPQAMPDFGRALNDGQVAAVVNHIRSNFGNAYADRVSPDDVKAARQ